MHTGIMIMPDPLFTHMAQQCIIIINHTTFVITATKHMYVHNTPVEYENTLVGYSKKHNPVPYRIIALWYMYASVHFFKITHKLISYKHELRFSYDNIG